VTGSRALRPIAPSIRICAPSRLEPSLRTPREGLTLFGVSELASSGSWVCYGPALQIGDVSKVFPVDTLSLLLIAVFAVMLLHERPTIQEWIGYSWLASLSSFLGSRDERPRAQRYTIALRSTALA
jgi:drug/metabolite transporter (DMT)-like permease